MNKSLVLSLGSSCIAALLAAGSADAKVTRIVIDSKQSPAFNGATFGAAGPYEILRAGPLASSIPRIRTTASSRTSGWRRSNARGMVEYTATFQIVKPVDMSKASHLMWHDVPNRGGEITIVPDERAIGDIGLASGWQGDNSGADRAQCQERICHRAGGA